MNSLFGEGEEFEVAVFPDPNWPATGRVRIEVLRNGVRECGNDSPLQEMNWSAPYRELAERLSVNEHQLSAMEKGLVRGRTLRFNLHCYRGDLVSAGFLSC
jgi:hypothetical protein